MPDTPTLTENDPTPSERPGMALFTDLYEISMAQAYFEEGMEDEAVFELFFRSLPPGRGYLLAAGLDDGLTRLEELRFTEADLAYLRQRSDMSEAFLQRLRTLRFTGDVHAVREGTPVFPDEPLVQVVAPMLVAQLVETYVLNQIHFQTVVATKAARIAEAAGARTVVDFGSRRAHGTDAALKVARCGHVAGLTGTSNVLAASRYDVPVFGTMAHSYIQAHDSERQAFEAFARLYPDTTLLVDTYDTLEGVKLVVELATRETDRLRIGAIRLDSGDLGELAHRSREILDGAGLEEVDIFVSGGLDEYRIRELLDAGAPIDGFGVGTRLVTSEDAPALDMAYKLVEYAGRPRMKRSSGKGMYPGRKQVYRLVEAGTAVGDVIGRADGGSQGRPLLEPVMLAGKRTEAGARSLDEAREHARVALAELPERIRALDPEGEPYPVDFSDELEERRRQVARGMPGSPAGT